MYENIVTSISMYALHSKVKVIIQIVAMWTLAANSQICNLAAKTVSDFSYIENSVLYNVIELNCFITRWGFSTNYFTIPWALCPIGSPTGATVPFLRSHAPKLCCHSYQWHLYYQPWFLCLHWFPFSLQTAPRSWLVAINTPWATIHCLNDYPSVILYLEPTRPDISDRFLLWS